MKYLLPLLLISSVGAWYPKEENRRYWHIGINFLIPVSAFYLIKADTKKKVIYSGIAATVLGASKEVYDEVYGQGFDRYDMIDNLIGTALGLAVFTLTE